MSDIVTIDGALRSGVSFFQDYIPRHCAANGLDAAAFMDAAREPEPAICPHCGRELRYPPIGGEDGLPAFWRPIPEPCPNPECQRIEAKAEAKRVHQERLAELRRLLPMSGVPTDYLTSTTQNYETANVSLRAALKAVRSYIATLEGPLDGGGLYIEGSVGTGKTHLAAAIARGAIWYGHTVLFTSSTRLLDQIKAGYSDGDDSFARRCRNVGLLIVDDIGKEYGTAWALSEFADIIGTRYAHRRPVVYTSNFPLADDASDDLMQALARRDGGDAAEAIVSRIAGACRRVEVIGDDWRRKA